MNTKDLLRITSELKDIMEKQQGTIAAAVAQEAFDYGDGDIIPFFRDLARHGCISGMVSQLIYYVDTQRFFDEHYEEIEDLRFVYLESGGEPLRIEGDLKNALAWFGFEQTAERLVDELEIDLS
ncbi:MAG: hypothetical protein GC178_18175 [Flavobacteriales bacterium]|nr:hypothetical protein [Flavobacteriales bacterium]